MKTLATILLLVSVSVNLYGQEYAVALHKTQAKLYLGYVNKVRISILHPKDTITPFTFNARAHGAQINYDNEGRMDILPTQKSGRVEVFAGMKGKFYPAGTFEFEAVQAPPLSDATFIEVMGITKDDPKTKLKGVKKFSPPSNKTVHHNNEFEIDGFPFTDLDKGLNIIKVSAIYLVQGNKYVPQKGDIKMISSDANIQKVDKNTFYLTPLAKKKKITFEVHLNETKLKEFTMRVYERD